MTSCWLRNSAFLLALAGAGVPSGPAATTGAPVKGTRATPPTLNAVSPAGIARGATAEMTVEGLNLARASAIYFSRPGVTGKILRVKELPDLPDIRLGSNGTPSTIDLGPLPPRNQVTVELQVAPDADIGPVSFRLLTPLGTSPEGRFLIEPYYGEAPDREPNDTPETAFDTFLPAILTGAISKPGDVDYFKIHAAAGQVISFLNGAMLTGSSLQPVVTIFDADLNVVGEHGARGGRGQVMFAQRFAKAGAYYIRVADFQHSGKPGHTYRIVAGEFPLVESVYPLGLRQGASASLALGGWHIAPNISVTGAGEDTLTLRPEHAFNEVRVAVGPGPEIDSQGGAISIPVTVNGRIAAPGAENRYRFHAAKGERLIFEVNARRLGSDLDSLLEVLDATGHPIERAEARPVWETSLTLRDHNSTGRGMRLSGWNALQVGDYVMVGAEIVRVEALPLSPDADTIFEAFGNQRIAFFDTTPEAHAVDSAVYKVQIDPPGAKLPPNGLPIAHLYYRNDDGGPGYGKDSLVHFTAPAAADYIVRIRDTEGLGGPAFGYRLTVRRPRPDFRLAVSPRNPNVPAGGAIPLAVTASRMDGFDGPIEISLADLPPGLHAAPGVVLPGQDSATLTLSADADAKLASAAPLKVIGKAGDLVRAADPEDRLNLIALGPHPDILVTAETQAVTLAPGGKAEIAVSIARQGGFRGRVPVQLLNLPPRVRVLDVGLNGVLITEDESRRSFTLEALPNAQPGEQLIYVAGKVETRSPQPSEYVAPTAIKLRVANGQ